MMLLVAMLTARSVVESFQPLSITAVKINGINAQRMSKQNHFNSPAIPSSVPVQANTILHMSTENSPETTTKKSDLPMLLDPGTKGGALFLSLVLFIVPIIIYEIVTLGLGVDGVEAGKWIGVGFTFFTTVLWVSTYIFRVATKDMTYVSLVLV